MITTTPSRPQRPQPVTGVTGVTGVAGGARPPGSRVRRRRKAGWLLGSAMVATGLMAGLFYTYAISVMLGLGRTDDRTFVLAMQRINESIQNAAFLPVFFGAFVLPAGAAVLHRRLGLRDATRWIVAATILYGVALAVSFGVNIPLNDQLDRAGDPDVITNLAAVRDRFEGPWVAWNVVRALLSTAALGCLGRALVLHGATPERS